MAQGNNPLGVVGHKKAVPSADDIISIHLLSENDADFGYLKKEATLYLKSALMMLNNSPFLRSKFGGDGIPQASVLAELLKQRADTLNFQLHVDDMSRQLLARELRKTNMNGMSAIALPLYQHNGARYRYPADILGLREAVSANLEDRVAEGMRVPGVKTLNAWGRWAKPDGTQDVLTFNDDTEVERAANAADLINMQHIM